MSCSNKKCACARREQPRAEMIDVSAVAALGETGLDTVRALLVVARTGLSGLAKLNLANDELRILARTIAMLYEERNNLENLLASIAVTDTVAVTADATDVKIGFGPDKKYTLIIPIIENNAKQTTANEFRASPAVQATDAKQLPLPMNY